MCVLLLKLPSPYFTVPVNRQEDVEETLSCPASLQSSTRRCFPGQCEAKKSSTLQDRARSLVTRSLKLSRLTWKLYLITWVNSLITVIKINK